MKPSALILFKQQNKAKQGINLLIDNTHRKKPKSKSVKRIKLLQYSHSTQFRNCFKDLLYFGKNLY